MRFDLLLPLLAAFPMAAAAPVYLLGRRKPQRGLWALIGAATVELILCLLLFLSPQPPRFDLEGFIGLRLSFSADGFRALYALIACMMWLMTSLFTPQYLSHGHKQARYTFFTLLTLGATAGVFLSDDLITCFLFFEILGFTSYCWVVHEENPAAMRAGQTYLAVAILGGMAMLMGLMLLQARLHTLRFDELAQAAGLVPLSSLYLPGALILAGFGAKAGMFPLHIWLPKAHPVAPAPASALLSGVLTKVGIFGILVISTRLFHADPLWGNLLLGIGLINMFLGALLALMSVDLKRTLACSSMSQIGFILVGIGMQGLLGEHNALAAEGTVLHMLNHSLIKLVLFMAAGVVYLNVHSLNLNDIRGWGRKRRGLKLMFFAGAASISGIPMFSGYASKTLLHESIVEYIEHLHHLGLGAFWYQAAEWVFIISGGLTFCYMLKLFITIFIEKHPNKQPEFDRMGPSMTPLSAAAIGASALILFVLGLSPESLMIPIADSALHFLKAHPPEHAVRFLTWVNISGALKSLVIGLLLYLTVVRRLLTTRDKHTGAPRSLNRWPAWLDMENSLYRPLIKALTNAGFLLCAPLNANFEHYLIPVLYRTGSFIALMFNGLTEGVIYAVRRLAFKRRKEPYVDQPGPRLSATGRLVISNSADAFRHIRRVVNLRLDKYNYLMTASFISLKEACQRNINGLILTLVVIAGVAIALLIFLLK